MIFPLDLNVYIYSIFRGWKWVGRGNLQMNAGEISPLEQFRTKGTWALALFKSIFPALVASDLLIVRIISELLFISLNSCEEDH
jgi:hypothetical protein